MASTGTPLWQRGKADRKRRLLDSSTPAAVAATLGSGGVWDCSPSPSHLGSAGGRSGADWLACRPCPPSWQQRWDALADSGGGAAQQAEGAARRQGRSSPRYADAQLRHRQLAGRVATFVDEEAEASSDASEDELDADADGGGFEPDFIDDASPAAGGPGRAGRLSMYHRSLATAALQTPREPWRGRAAAVVDGAAAQRAVVDTPGARSDSGYDLEDSFLDEGEGDGGVPETQQSHDDECGVCGQGGELLCCDGCRAVFHLACLRMASVPPGDWFCAVCADGA
ncbi:hypothetical protein WJX81_000518 [Elliptochloris bilobata]|uniref:PHD-type domain-containing protein n=1 Tax=Elliptochloris bilobata TaxID=381761 RepID=A0AAW1S7S1_9CHLO